MQPLFQKRKNEVTYGRLWKDKKFNIFNHYIIQEMSFLQKLRIVHAIDEVPSKHRSSMEGINALRNPIDYSFFPESRRQYLKYRRVQYDGEDIYTKSGIEKLLNNATKIVDYLKARAGE